MSAPTFVSETETTWGSPSSPKSQSITVNAGDVLVILGISEIYTTTLATPTGGSQTYTLKQSSTISGNCAMYLWTAVMTTSQTFNLAVTSTGGGWWGVNILRFSGSAGVGASSGTSGSGAPSLGLTTTADNSAIVCVNADGVPVDGATRTWRTVNSITPTAGNGQEVTYGYVSGTYGPYGAYWSDVGAAGAKTVGMTAPTGQGYVIAAVEVLGSGGAPAFDGTRFFAHFD